MNAVVYDSTVDAEDSHALQDELLLQLIHERIGNRVRRLRLRRSGKGFILEGRTASYYGKQLAQHALMDVTDTPILANNIEVV
jgi:hypothetical protein